MSVNDQADHNGYQVQVVEEDGVLRVIRLTDNQLQEVKKKPVKETQKAHNCSEMGCCFGNYNRMVRGDLVQSCGYCGKLDI